MNSVATPCRRQLPRRSPGAFDARPLALMAVLPSLRVRWRLVSTWLTLTIAGLRWG